MRFALVGAGYWGPNLLRNLLLQKEITSVVVCDRDQARLEFIAERFPRVETTTSFESVLGDREVKAVLLATPISTHGTLGAQVLEAGKDLFVEKPLATSTVEAETLVRLARANGRVLMVGHTFEYSPPVLKTKEIIDRGELGQIYFVSMLRVNLGLHQRDASVIWDLVPHDFSILMHWLDESPSRISATARDCVQSGIPDVAFIHATFPSGVVANIEVAWLAPSKLRRTAVVGARKMLVYDDTENIEKLKIYDQGVRFSDPETFGEFQLSYRTGDIVSPRLPSAEPLRQEMEHFVSCVKTRATPRTDGESGLRIVRALEATQQSIESGRPVDLPAVSS
ncbi:MAG: Gfo/Idh/MocA family oxidoreductase [Deltaproteobacteria bacterium]|nr:Gfo/Idh/MocA family oxidoreductase [Deltaproteobacteria bacterium]